VDGIDIVRGVKACRLFCRNLMGKAGSAPISWILGKNLYFQNGVIYAVYHKYEYMVGKFMAATNFGPDK